MKIQNHLFTLVSQEPLCYYESCYKKEMVDQGGQGGVWTPRKTLRDIQRFSTFLLGWGKFECMNSDWEGQKSECEDAEGGGGI